MRTVAAANTPAAVAPVHQLASTWVRARKSSAPAHLHLGGGEEEPSNQRGDPGRGRGGDPGRGHAGAGAGGGGGGGRQRWKTIVGGGFKISGVIMSFRWFSPGRNKVPSDLYFGTEGVQCCPSKMSTSFGQFQGGDFWF